MATPTGNLFINETLALADLCRACGGDPAQTVALIDEGVVTVRADDAFPATALRRLRIAVRLHRELELNPAGAALAVDLLDEISRLRARVELLEYALGFDPQTGDTRSR